MAEIKAISTSEVEISGSSSCANKDMPYYIILVNKTGSPINYNYCGVWSSSPYDGFNCSLPLGFRSIIETLLSDKKLIVSEYNEYTAQTGNEESGCGFLITVNKQNINDEEWYQYLIRPTDSLNPILEECNKQLLHERKLNKINFKCISSVSHDFRTPLSIIYANLQLLEHHELKLDRETVEDSFSLSRMAVKSLLRVLDKVTLIDSINKGRLEFKPGTLNLKSICVNLVKELNDAEVLPDRIQYLHDDRIQDIELDQYLFKSLFTHLIYNALNYSKKSQHVVFQSNLIDKNTIRFSVKDYGIGLKPEQIELLLVYFRGSMDVHPEGIGLGLAIVKECSNHLRGEISVVSELGKGSEFIVDIPFN